MSQGTHDPCILRLLAIRHTLGPPVWVAREEIVRTFTAKKLSEKRADLFAKKIIAVSEF